MGDATVQRDQTFGVANSTTGPEREDVDFILAPWRQFVDAATAVLPLAEEGSKARPPRNHLLFGSSQPAQRRRHDDDSTGRQANESFEPKCD